MILITSNRGLCGAYNTQVIKKSILLLKNKNMKIDAVTVGKKGDVAMRRLGVNVVATFTLSDKISLNEIFPISAVTGEGLGGLLRRLAALGSR